MPQPMVRAHIKSSTAAAAESARGASSPVHAAIHADAAAPSVPLTPASPAAGPTGWRRRAAPPRTAALRSRAAESTRGASSPAHAAYTPMMPLLCRVLQSSGPSRQRALKTSAAAESTRGASSPAHAAYTPMMPRTPTPFAPAGAEKVHAAADGSGAYQMTDRRRSGKHAPRIIPRARRIHADDAAFVPRAAILRPARASGR